jgi:hypothetical protein
MAALDRLLARDPLDRLAPLPPEPVDDEDDGRPGDHVDIPPASPISPDDPVTGAPCHPQACDADEGEGGDGDRTSRVSVEDEGVEDEEVNDGGVRDPSGPGASAGRQVKFPALINLIVPAATLLGWGAAPGQAGAWGLTDPRETRDIVRAASLHPRTRWCLTVVNERGEAVAHACAPGRHPWKPETPDPPPGAAGQRALIWQFLTDLGMPPGTLERIAQGTCDHQHAEPRYVPSRKLRHLIRARSQTCTAPGCGGQSVHADQDHVIPYPDGPTDECNLHTPCRSHHRAKQSPGWRVEQLTPGVIRWTLPNGRTRTTRPTIYDC